MKNFSKTVLLTGLFVGTTDIVSAFITQWVKTGKFAGKMFDYIAGGALGLETSMQGGNATAFLGLFFHYFIAMAFTLLFFAIFAKIKFLAYDKFLIGMLYAVFVNVVMDQVILPMSRLPRGSFDLSAAFIGWIVFGLVFGIPIAYNAYKYYGVRSE